MELQNKRIPQDEFESIRSEILTQWPTGKDVNLEEAFAYHKALPEHKIFGKKLSDAKKQGITLIQPRAGVALIKEHVELLQFLQDALSFEFQLFLQRSNLCFKILVFS